MESYITWSFVSGPFHLAHVFEVYLSLRFLHPFLPGVALVFDQIIPFPSSFVILFVLGLLLYWNPDLIILSTLWLWHPSCCIQNHKFAQMGIWTMCGLQPQLGLQDSPSSLTCPLLDPLAISLRDCFKSLSFSSSNLKVFSPKLKKKKSAPILSKEMEICGLEILLQLPMKFTSADTYSNLQVHRWECFSLCSRSPLYLCHKSVPLCFFWTWLHKLLSLLPML